MEYRKSYGGRFGRDGKPPDFDLCAEEVRVSRDRWDIRFKQCPRKAKYDPDANGKPTTCGVHSEARKKARDEKNRAKWAADDKRRKLNADIAAVRRSIELVDCPDAKAELRRILAGLEK